MEKKGDNTSFAWKHLNPKEHNKSTTIKMYFAYIVFITMIAGLFVWYSLKDSAEINNYLKMFIELSIYAVMVLILFKIVSLIFKSVTQSKTFCAKTILTPYSILHFFAHFPITLLLFILTNNILLSILLGGLGIAIIWEIIEYILIPFYPNFSCETNKNRIVDIALGVLGSLLLLLVI